MDEFPTVLSLIVGGVALCASLGAIFLLGMRLGRLEKDVQQTEQGIDRIANLLGPGASGAIRQPSKIERIREMVNREGRPLSIGALVELAESEGLQLSFRDLRELMEHEGRPIMGDELREMITEAGRTQQDRE